MWKIYLLLWIEDHKLRSLAPAIVISCFGQGEHYQQVVERRKTTDPTVEGEVTRNLIKDTTVSISGKISSCYLDTIFRQSLSPLPPFLHNTHFHLTDFIWQSDEFVNFTWSPKLAIR